MGGVSREKSTGLGASGSSGESSNTRTESLGAGISGGLNDSSSNAKNELRNQSKDEAVKSYLRDEDGGVPTQASSASSAGSVSLAGSAPGPCDEPAPPGHGPSTIQAKDLAPRSTSSSTKQVGKPDQHGADLAAGDGFPNGADSSEKLTDPTGSQGRSPVEARKDVRCNSDTTAEDSRELSSSASLSDPSGDSGIEASTIRTEEGVHGDAKRAGGDGEDNVTQQRDLSDRRTVQHDGYDGRESTR